MGVLGVDTPEPAFLIYFGHSRDVHEIVIFVTARGLKRMEFFVISLNFKEL
jgi:hypothetical protein